MTKIDFIARHEKIRVEKAVILKQPTCPTDKARRHLFVISLFYNLFRFYLLIPIKIDGACNTETDQKRRDPLLYRNRLLNWKHNLSYYLYHKSNENVRVNEEGNGLSTKLKKFPGKLNRALWKTAQDLTRSENQTEIAWRTVTDITNVFRETFRPNRMKIH